MTESTPAVLPLNEQAIAEAAAVDTLFGDGERLIRLGRTHPDPDHKRWFAQEVASRVLSHPEATRRQGIRP